MPDTYISPAETGFYYLQSRYYDPANCRFINADSFASTGQGFLGHNMFVYCNNSPINRCDPCGTLNQMVNCHTCQARPTDALSDMMFTLRALGFSDRSVASAAQCATTLENYEIDTIQEKAHFFSQCYVESNLSLTEAGYLSFQVAEEYRKQKSYYPYYGAGYLQLTWEDNYRSFSEHMGDPRILSDGPQYVAQNYAWTSAGWYWSSKGINDMIANGANVKQVTLAVNGGTSQLSEREERYNIYLAFFGG